MSLLPESLPNHPDGDNVNKVDPECIGYRSQSKWRNRYCGNCGWFQELENALSMPDVSGDEHPSADNKGTVHGCALVGGGIAKGGYCIAWGTFGFAQGPGSAVPMTEPGPADAEPSEDMLMALNKLRQIKKRLS